VISSRTAFKLTFLKISVMELILKITPCIQVTDLLYKFNSIMMIFKPRTP